MLGLHALLEAREVRQEPADLLHLVLGILQALFGVLGSPFLALGLALSCAALHWLAPSCAFVLGFWTALG